MFKRKIVFKPNGRGHGSGLDAGLSVHSTSAGRGVCEGGRRGLSTDNIFQEKKKYWPRLNSSGGALAGALVCLLFAFTTRHNHVLRRKGKNARKRRKCREGGGRWRN